MGTSKKIGCPKGTIPWNKGKPWSKKVKEKISLSKIGCLGLRGSKAPWWKGNKAKYHSIHNWIRRNWGKPKCCDKCKTISKPGQKNNIEWSSNKKKITRDRKNWQRLCRSCHCKKDKLVENFHK